MGKITAARKTLNRLGEEIRMKKKVFVSGCYDMLHSGHVAFFEQSAKLGELYVGIGSDKTIESLKKKKNH